MRRIALFALCLTTTSGCAPAYQPAVDMAGVNPEIYHDDLAACRTKTGRGFAGGPAVADTLIVASLGVTAGAFIAPVFVGMNAGLAESYGAMSGAAAGGAVGAATGVTPSKVPDTTPPPSSQKAAINRCLTDYGYKVQPQS